MKIMMRCVAMHFAFFPEQIHEKIQKCELLKLKFAINAMDFKTFENAHQYKFSYPFLPITQKNENNDAMRSDAFRIFSLSKYMRICKNVKCLNRSFPSMQWSSTHLKMHTNTN